MFQRAGQILGALGELVTDRQTRTRASTLVEESASSRIANLTKGTADECILACETPAPRQARHVGVRQAGGGLQGRLQAGWQRAQRSWEEQRLFWERQRLQTSIQASCWARPASWSVTMHAQL